MIKYSKDLQSNIISNYICVLYYILGFTKVFIFVFRSEGGMRRGYMGHLTRIANTVVHNLEKGPVHTQITSLITGLFIRLYISVYTKWLYK